MASNRQDRYEFDLSPDGTPSGGTSRSGENTAVTGIAHQTPFALRVGVQRDGGGGGSLKLDARLEYSTSTSGPWTEVPEDGSRVAELFELVDNTGYAHDASITSQELSGSGTWVNGRAGDGDGGSNQLSQVQIGTGNCTEVQFNVQSNGASGGTQYYFRVTDAGAAIQNYDVYPDLTTESIGYTLTAESGSYLFTGTDATLAADRSIDASAGSYTTTGQDATLNRTYVVSAEAGSYTTTGQDVTLKADYKVSAGSGVYTITGTTATLGRDFTLIADSGSYALTGQDVTLTYGGDKSIVAEPGSYAIAGQDSVLKMARSLQAGTSSYLYSGSDTNLSMGYGLVASSGSYSVSGQDILLAVARNLPAEAGSYSLLIFCLGKTQF
jgi:hypothetical protein